MLRRTTLLSVALLLAGSACSPATPAGGITRPPTSSTRAPTTQPTTTTTIAVALQGSTPELTALIRAFYNYASGAVDIPPEMPATVLAQITPASGISERSGTASIATFKGDQVATVEVGADVFLAIGNPEGWRIVGGVWPSITLPAYYGAAPRLLAVVGSDARTGQSVETSRADSIHFVGLDGAGNGAVVGLPRDSYVPVPGHGKRNITESLALGGPELTMQTFTDLTGLNLEGYVLTGFAGFQSLVDGVLGGIDVFVPFAINDVKAKAALSAGAQILNGFDALAFARARKTLPGGDFDRSEHQGFLLIGAAKGVRAMGIGAVPGLLEAAEPSLVTNLDAEHLLTFSAMLISSNLDEIPNFVAPGTSGRAGSASVVYLADSANQIFEDLADGNLGN